MVRFPHQRELWSQRTCLRADVPCLLAPAALQFQLLLLSGLSSGFCSRDAVGSGGSCITKFTSDAAEVGLRQLRSACSAPRARARALRTVC